MTLSSWGWRASGPVGPVAVLGVEPSWKGSAGGWAGVDEYDDALVVGGGGRPRGGSRLPPGPPSGQGDALVVLLTVGAANHRAFFLAQGVILLASASVLRSTHLPGSVVDVGWVAREPTGRHSGPRRHLAGVCLPPFSGAPICLGRWWMLVGWPANQLAVILAQGVILLASASVLRGTLWPGSVADAGRVSSEPPGRSNPAPSTTTDPDALHPHARPRACRRSPAPGPEGPRCVGHPPPPGRR